MTEGEFAARLVVIEQRLNEVTNLVRLLFQDVVDSLPDDDVE